MTAMERSWEDYLKRIAEDKVSNLLLSIMFLLDALHFALDNESNILLYVSFLLLIADIIWCDVVLYRQNIKLSDTANKILKYTTFAVCAAIAVSVVIGIIV